MNIENFFYDRTSKRIADRISKTNLRHIDIYKPDHKQISRIINNERTKNNRFLVCDAVLSNYYEDDKTGKFKRCGLLESKELNFKNEEEILWGTTTEISSYIYDLYLLLWNEVITSPSPYNIDSELYLCDFVPFAKNSTYFKILFLSNNTYPAKFYGIREDSIVGELDTSENDALLFLYSKLENEFSNFFQAFTRAQKSYHKLDKTINDILLPQFVKILESHKPNFSSLGLRVRDLIIADLSHSAPMIAEQNYQSFYTQLISASSNYILELERIQAVNLK